jgi:hypothetical protein
MEKLLIVTISIFLGLAPLLASGQKHEEDIIKTAGGDLKITFIGHGTLMFTYQNKIIHVDPVSSETDYTKLPKADLILLPTTILTTVTLRL